MPDFPFTESSIWTGLYCLFFYLFILILNYRRGVVNYGKISATHSFRVIMLLLVCFFIITHCLKGDFFHLMEKVHDYVLIEGYYNYGEAVYPIIGDFVNNNYFLFRVIVWGGSFVLFLITSKRLDIDPYNAAMMLIMAHSIAFSYARASAAMALYFFGLSFLIKPAKHKLIGFIIGILLIVASVAFHRSALIMVLMTILLFVPINRWTITVFIVGFFILSGVFKEYFEIIAYSADIDDTVADKLQRYSERTINSGIASRMSSLFDYASFLIPSYISLVIILLNKKGRNIPIYYKKLNIISLGLVAVSVMFYFWGSSFVTFFYRILYMSMIPLTLSVCYMWNNRLITKKQMLICFLPGVFYNLFQYLYSVYLANMGIN